jgi:hypothetical protein
MNRTPFLRPAVAAAATFEVYKDKSGEYRWRLRMQNTKVIATYRRGLFDQTRV